MGILYIVNLNRSFDKNTFKLPLQRERERGGIRENSGTQPSYREMKVNLKEREKKEEEGGFFVSFSLPFADHYKRL